jgi:trehalose 6-phosphate phosphatase
MKNDSLLTSASRLISLANARYLLVCSDYDGTLAPISSRPEFAQLLPGAFKVLNNLARLEETRVAIVSGRAREDLRLHSGFTEPIVLVGSHGAELNDNLDHDSRLKVKARLLEIESDLSQICSNSPGIWLEHKPLGLAVHVRQASDLVGFRVFSKVRDWASKCNFVHITEGKAVLDVSLVRTDKGEAVRFLRKSWGSNPQVLYLGDDVTDESAFQALAIGDVGVKVGFGPSVAEYRVQSESEAVDMLNLLFDRRSLVIRQRIAWRAWGQNSA